MNANTRERFLQIAETEVTGPDLVALLGRDIRTSQEVIADYCITENQPIYEDLAVLVESMAFIDRAVTRHRSESWSRELSIRIPVYELGVFRRREVIEALTDAARFLTGDNWSFEFIRRKASSHVRQTPLPLMRSKVSQVIPYSDGLDSFAQVKLSIHAHNRDGVLLVRAGLSKDKVFPHLMSLRVPREFRGIRMRELTYRTRPMIFFTFAGIAAHLTDAASVAIGENGQGSLGAACLPFADEWWFRSTHPAFVKRWAGVLSQILEKPIHFEQPNLWKTKGEMLAELLERNLTEGWDKTNSCSTRPVDRFGYKACGVCGGCLLRIVSALSAGLSVPPEQFAFDVRGTKDELCDHNGRLRSIPSCHRHVAVRAISTMEEFARLLDSPNGSVTINREANLIDEKNPGAAEKSLVSLLQRHRSEWASFKDSIAAGSWFHEIVAQL